MTFEGRIARIRHIREPAKRWRAIDELQAEITLLRTDVSALRTELVLQMRSEGLSFQQIAAALGVSKSRVAQVAAQRTGDGA